MNRSLKTRLAALAASLLITFALVDGIANYAFDTPTPSAMVAAHRPAAA